MSIEQDLTPGERSWSADVVIIGSGAAGAVWADRLAAKGRDVLVLEEGAHHPSSSFTQREDEMYRRLYREGANQPNGAQTVNVLQGRCVGGSTVVNMADVERIPSGVLAHWRRLTGIDEFSEKTFLPFHERCERDIGANTIALEDLNRNNQLLREGTIKLGHKGSPLRHNRVGCLKSGYCLIGCAYDAKRSTLVTLLPRALQAGARITAGARIDRLVAKDGKITGAVGTRLDPQGKSIGTFSVRAKDFVLAAGAIHTPLILLRSGLTQGPVGENLSLQPQVPVVAFFDETVRAYRGIPQSFVHTQFEACSEEEGLGGFRIEGIAGGPSMMASGLGAVGEQHRKIMLRFNQMTSALVLVPDRPGGTVRPGSDPYRAAIDYELQPLWKKQAAAGVRTAAEIYFAAGAGEVGLPFAPFQSIAAGKRFEVPEHLFRTGNVQAISAHPQGTCRIGVDPAESVVNAEGRHHHFPNLLITDASLFPTTAATHTMIPVMAMADWLVTKYLT